MSRSCFLLYSTYQPVKILIKTKQEVRPSKSVASHRSALYILDPFSVRNGETTTCFGCAKGTCIIFKPIQGMHTINVVFLAENALLFVLGSGKWDAYSVEHRSRRSGPELLQFALKTVSFSTNTLLAAALVLLVPSWLSRIRLCIPNWRTQWIPDLIMDRDTQLCQYRQKVPSTLYRTIPTYLECTLAMTSNVKDFHIFCYTFGF